MIEPTLLTNTPYTFFLKLVRGPDFPGGPVVKTLPSSAGGMGSVKELRFYMPGGPKKHKTEAIL